MVGTGMRSRLMNRHATARQHSVDHRLFHAAGLAWRQPVGLRDVTVARVDANLTCGGRTERKTNWHRRVTNHTSAELRKYAQQIGPAAGRVYEKLRHVDV